MDTTSASPNTSKIVVGVALAAVFGTGIYFYGVRNAHDTHVPPAIAAVPPPPPAATAPPAPPPVGPADQVVSDEGQVTPAAATGTATTNDVAQNEASTTPAESAAPAQQETAPAPATHHVARHSKASDSVANSNTDTASNTPTQPAAPAPAVTPPPVASTTAPATGSADAAPSAQDGAAPSPTATADTGTSDSKISSDVKSEIASAAPNSNVNVTTTNGVVALTGSVPSQDAVAQAKQVAMTVQGVKTVDTSQLLVASN